MTDKQKDVLVTLSEPLKYAYEGELVEGTFIQLNPPTSRNMTECAFQKQAFYRSIPKNVEAPDENASDDPVTGEMIMQLILMSDTVDLGPVLISGRELLTSGVALVEGETKLTKPLMNDISQNDLEKLVGEYMANFILASELQKAKGN